ncbi:MAG TPA: PEP-CTERM sorting domain-containing protein [Xanthomonadaceae bacterium]|jgi:hypothetical protein|nr:PEP-CTERM sorting domain-containing protein [Xanthomonadaceae bacterium]
MSRAGRHAGVRVAVLGALLLGSGVLAAQTLTGWATLPAATFADGPTSGRAAAPNPWGTNLPPYIDRQPVQGFSGVLAGPRPDTFHFLVDNGFGARANSADALLRRYTVAIDWRTRRGGAGRVLPADRDSGRPREAFDARTRITFDEAPPTGGRVNDRGRALTGADFDPESIVRAGDGSLWLGDEFGPFLLKTDARGRLLRTPIALPGVRAPTHPEVLGGRAEANLPASGGFEGLAIAPDGSRLFAMLEQPVAGDPPGLLRISEFDPAREDWTGRHWMYPLSPQGTAIGDLVALDGLRFIVIERNSGTATTPLEPFKRLYLVELAGRAAGATAGKTLLVDLMDIADPHDLDGDGRTRFDFPFNTVESLLVLDRRTLLVANDNNFPYGGGRRPESDATEVLRVRLDTPLW